MCERFGAFSGIICHQMPITDQPPFINHKPFEPHGSPCMNLVGADADFRTQTETKTITETTAAVDEHIGRIDLFHKLRSPLPVAADDHICVAGSISVYVVYGVFY